MDKKSDKSSWAIGGTTLIGVGDMALAEWANRVQNTNNEHFDEAQTSRNYSRADHQTRIDRWKENLSMEDIKRVIPILQKTAKQFGYALNQMQLANKGG